MITPIYLDIPAIVTGGEAHHNDILKTSWAEETEAAHFVSVMLAAGIDEKRLFLEKQATNTGENARFSLKLAERLAGRPRSLLIVTKPYMERRAYATFKAQWADPGAEIKVTSVGGSLTDYCNEDNTFEKVVNIMIGDLRRIETYPERGWQIHQDIPPEVSNASAALARAGYDKHLL